MQLKLSMLVCLHMSEQAHGPYRSSQDTAVVQESSPHFYESALPRVKLQRANCAHSWDTLHCQYMPCCMLDLKLAYCPTAMFSL